MRFAVTKERLIMWFVWLLPKWIVYWCAIRLGAYATCGKYGSQIVPELKFMDALDRWAKQGENQCVEN